MFLVAVVERKGFAINHDINEWSQNGKLIIIEKEEMPKFAKLAECKKVNYLGGIIFGDFY